MLKNKNKKDGAGKRHRQTNQLCKPEYVSLLFQCRC